MHMRPLIWLCTLFVFLAQPSVADESKPAAWKGMERMMSREDFEAAGLSKLTPEEMARLNDWMKRFLAYESTQVVSKDKEIQELQSAPVRRRIAGEFRGWKGDTIFKLDNGEVWKQRGDGRYSANLENPEVEISKNFIGFYELRVVKTGAKIGVTRIK
jgi:hypothetical protein